MLLRNLKSTQSLCNKTRLQVKSIRSKTLDCRILEGEHDDKRHYISRISLALFDSNSLHASFRRVQFSIRLTFSIIINKSQDQFLQHVDLYLHLEVFAHDQLYVTLSRVTSKVGLFIVALDDLSRKQSSASTRCIRNKVIR